MSDRPRPRVVVVPELVEDAPPSSSPSSPPSSPPERPLAPWQRDILGAASHVFGAVDFLERVGDALDDALADRRRARRARRKGRRP